MLGERGPIDVLIDNSVLGHGVTHETAWISTGQKLWGGNRPIETGHLARVPVHRSDPEARLYEQVRFLPGLALLASKALIRLHTSKELLAERLRQPLGRFIGYGWYDYNVFGHLQIPSLDGILLDLNSDPAASQRARLEASRDEVYKAILAELQGRKKDQDAWHIATAERHRMHCFLCMDFPLRDQVRQHAKKEPFKSLRTRVLLPSELADELRLAPLDPHLLSYEGSSFPVRADLNMPEGRRRPVSQYKRNP